MKAKCFKVVVEELKQRISAKSEKLRCYCARDNQYRNNKLSRCNQKALYQEFGGKVTPAQVPSNAEEAKEFWSILWDNPVPYKDDAEWLKEVELELENVNVQDKVETTKEDVTMQLRNMPNWKATGQEGILEFWLKRFNSQHQRLTEELNENIQSISLPNWLLKSRTVLIQKDPAKGNDVRNY